MQGALPSPLLTPGEGREHQALVQLLRGPEIVHQELGLLRLGLLRGIKASLELLQLEGEGAALRACSPKAGGFPRAGPTWARLMRTGCGKRLQRTLWKQGGVVSDPLYR